MKFLYLGQFPFIKIFLVFHQNDKHPQSYYITEREIYNPQLEKREIRRFFHGWKVAMNNAAIGIP